MISEERESMLGTVFSQYSFTVERGKIREFAAAVGDMKDIYVDREKAAGQGYSDVAAPPTFGTVIDHWGNSGSDIFVKLKINPVMVLHGEQEYEYLGDIVAGDELRAAMTFTGYSEKKNMYVFTFLTVYVNQRDDEVLRCRQVVLERK